MLARVRVCVRSFVHACSVEWMGREGGGDFLSVGTNHSAVQLWDASKLRQARKDRLVARKRVHFFFSVGCVERQQLVTFGSPSPE